tara:strand:+ start:2652 stop:3584 length:933 start_codon:yes stop_codon:yes gene_type:complete
MKIIFAGTPEIGLETLKAIFNSNHEVCLVITNEDKPSGRGKVISKSPIKIFAEENDIMLKQPKNLKEKGLVTYLKNINADLLVVFAYGHIIPEEILKILKNGALNIHTSLLPKLRGAAPIQRAIMNGDNETGISFMKMEKGLDTGPIYSQEKIKIEESETSKTLTAKMSKVSSCKVLEIIDLIDKNNYKLAPQDSRNATYAPKIMKEEAKIDWDESAIKIVNLINGLSPSPAAFSFLKNERINFYLAKLDQRPSSAPGQITQISNDELLIGAKDLCVKIIELSRPGKKRQNFGTFYNGSKKIFLSEKVFT